MRHIKTIKWIILYLLFVPSYNLSLNMYVPAVYKLATAAYTSYSKQTSRDPRYLGGLVNL